MKNLTEGEKMVCRNCGNAADEKFIKKEADGTFKSRAGCLVCNRWLEPVTLETAKEVLK